MKIRLVTAAIAVAALVPMSATPASAQVCNDKITDEPCQQVQNLICYLFEKCL